MADKVDSLTDLGEAGAKLRRLGFTNLEQVILTVPVAEQALSEYLGRPIREVLPVDLQLRARSHLLAAVTAAVPYSLGARVSWTGPATLGPLPPAAPAGTPSNRVDFSAQMPPVKNQAKRETCIAFASVAVLERHLGLAGAYQPMSEQFAYWLTKNLDGDPGGPGSWLKAMFQGLQVNGCCPTATWPYQLDPIPGNEPEAPPPAGAIQSAQPYVQPNTQNIWPQDLDSMIATLKSQRGVAFSVPVFPSSYGTPGAPDTYTQRTGDFLNPIPGESLVGGHAMCFVGYFELPDQPENGYGRFIVRNSWNDPQTPWAPTPNWGLPAGYGTISFMYIRMYCEEAFSIQ
jgi:hypothetical protein